MVSRTNIKHGLAGALLFILIGALSACSELPTAAGDDPPPAEPCVWIEGMIHCRPT